MSWQIASLAILGLVLLAGMAWYERTRPPSQIVALVAALAALAVAGRVALSPVPNVVPTTDIVILSGYALGGPPGFAVGALSGLISNFWLGQGPWTPWQMAGWGACGLFGAVLAAASHRRLGRIGLAAACGLAGFAFGALMDFSLMVSYGGEQSLDRYLALSARGLPFNVAHALGNVALALAAGPAIARMLLRYRERFEFAWSPAAPRRARQAGAGLAAVLLAVALAGQLAGGQRAEGASGGAVEWLREAQNGDGGFGPGLDDESDPAMTGWVALGLESAGVNPLDFGSPTPVAYLRNTVGEIRTTGDIERTILVLVGAGLDPRGFGGTNLVERLRARRSANGSMSGQVNLTAFAILALEAARADGGNSRSAAWLARARNPDGGWGFARGTASDPDSTGAAMQALAVAGSGRALRSGRAYLRHVQRRNGGYALLGGPVNSQSTAWAVQGLIAVGRSPGNVGTGGRSPLDYLARMHEGDGHYRYSFSSDQTPVWVTSQALAAVSGEAFPIDPVPRAPSQGKSDGASSGGAPGAEKAPLPKPMPGQAEAKEGAQAAAPGEAKPLEPAPARESAQDEGVSARAWAGIGALGIAAAVAGGWLLYRRRLP